MTTNTTIRPSWLKDHPQDLIFRHRLASNTILGEVWYRPIDLGFEIDYIEIHDSYRGHGLSINILNAFVEFCRSTHLGAEIWLEVSDLNIPAIKLYLRAGFKNVGLRKNYYQDGSDAILMSLK